MKINTLLALLCAALCSISSYGQEHNAPPRREIRHLITTDGSLTETESPMQRASGEYIMGKFPTEGEIKAVVILAAFADIPFSVSNDSITKLLSNRYNGDNYKEEVSFDEYSKVWEQYISMQVTIPGSARDYFRDQSLKKFSPSFDIIGPVTLPRSRKYYGANDTTFVDNETKDEIKSVKLDVKVNDMIKDACKAAYDEGLTDFSDYDNDGDGLVDIVYVVYSGSDEAQTGIGDYIWAKKSNLSSAITLGNKKIKRFACSAELVADVPVVAGIGTFVHEFSHVLGLPDFYNTKNSEEFTMSVWSVMDYGMYNAEGFVPCAYTAFERYSLGWIPMHTLDAPTTMSIGTTEEESTGYRIFTSNLEGLNPITKADTASFYVIETIRREGWNRYAPTNGLLISEVTYDASSWKNNIVNAGEHYRHRILPANNEYRYKTANYHLFGKGNQEFTLTSTPASITHFGVRMNKPLTEINYDAETGKTSFLFCGRNITDGVDGSIDYSDITIQHSELIYDLQGRIVENPSKGIYIRNGKKVVIK